MTDKFRNKYRILSARAQWWDYDKNGNYFITICTAGREHYMGKILNGVMELSDIGKYVRQTWLEIPFHFKFVILDEFAIMPDHFHGIITIDKPDRIINNNIGDIDMIETGHALSLSIPKPKPVISPHRRYRNQGKNTISAMVGSFKSAVTKWCNTNGYQFGWQTRFYDHIIRDNVEMERIRNYIKNNPAKWDDNKRDTQY